MIADRIKILWHLENELEMKSERIKRLEAQTYFPARNAIQNMEVNSINYMNALSALYRDYDRLYQEIAYLNDVINTLEDGVHKDVLQARYICHLTPGETSRKLHFSKRRIHQLTAEAFAKLSTKFDK